LLHILGSAVVWISVLSFDLSFIARPEEVEQNKVLVASQ
jgi:hypothetical protein